ncbi:MAG: competence/damage-inducible protein A [Lachnospiraceae bacterium]|nr:competence/damage-inducible protein A [Candidatus Fimimorpha excrementavium]
MVVELISVGTELLLGNIVNTNAQYLAQKCAELGLSVYYQSCVGDNAKRLEDTIRLALSRSDVVILGGGLGPTEDDITKETAAAVFETELKEDAHTRQRIEAYFEKNKEIPENNWKQAQVPAGAKVLDNDNGTAPGLIMEKGEKTLILLPGPPNELIPMFQESVIPYLKGRCSDAIVSAMIKSCGIGESKVAAMLNDIIEEQTNPTIATYAKTGEVDIRVTASAPTEKEAKKLVRPVVEKIKSRLKDAVFTTEEDVTLEEEVVRLLNKYELTLATAESCTGGLLGGRLVNVPGVSDVYKAGFITYSNKAKRKYLDVSKNTLKKYGAVSKETAKEMAKGGVFQTDADICIAVTGLAGPGGATKEKPVGLVYIACYIGDKVQVKEYHFKGNRNKIREQTVVRALDTVRRCILDKYHETARK